jgi:hypothetical protein
MAGLTCCLFLPRQLALEAPKRLLSGIREDSRIYDSQASLVP